MFSHSFDAEYVRPLAKAENQLLQVLVDRFRIVRKGRGFQMEVAFNEESPTIWLRKAKGHILDTLTPERRAAMQRKIDTYLVSEDEVFEHHDPTFPFRLGNGGTLPIVRLDKTDYYCLFYRDSHPTGWNIANGGGNTRHDLLHPDAIVERELREELIIVEPERGRWYVFDWHDACLRDHPDFALAHELWESLFRRQRFPKFEDIPLPLKWSLPPDANRLAVEQRFHDTMRIRCGSDPPIYTGQGFLNINAEDFGIEFDRIAKLSVGREAVFCDGELRDGKLLNRVVGLFAVSRVHRLLDEGALRFLPDRFFWDGEDRTNDGLLDVIGEFLKGRQSSWAEVEKRVCQHARPQVPCDPLDLCPVTRTIIERHRELRAAEPLVASSPAAAGPFDVFLSFASEDRDLAQQVYQDLSTAVPYRVFFSDVTMTAGGFTDQIDHALDTSWAFVAVGTRLEHLYKTWVKYEWSQFHNDRQSGMKPNSSPFVAFVSGIEPRSLPRPFRLEHAVTVSPEDPTPALARLKQFIVKPAAD